MATRNEVWEDGKGITMYDFSPTERIQDAFMVVEKMREKNELGCKIVIQAEPPKTMVWFYYYNKDGEPTQEGNLSGGVKGGE